MYRSPLLATPVAISSSRRPFIGRRSGFTLVEMLVAMTLTLLLMATVVEVFDMVGQGVTQSRSMLEISSSLRSTRDLLSTDLGNATCRTMPAVHPGEGLGYFTYIEGPRTDNVGATIDWSTLPDWKPIASGDPNNLDFDPSLLGDFDDMLLFTARSGDLSPFIGRAGGGGGTPNIVQSNHAEVMWYCVENPNVDADDPDYLGIPGLRTLYRRLFLVHPTVNNPTGNLASVNQNYDISMVSDGSNHRVNRSLSDLTKRENRRWHHTDSTTLAGFPHRYPYIASSGISFATNQIQVSGFDPQEQGFQAGMWVAINGSGNNDGVRQIDSVSSSSMTMLGANFESESGSRRVSLQAIPILTGTRQGEDVVLRNVLAFDVRAYDPAAPLRRSGTVVVAPGDPGWAGATQLNQGRGAYVDLNYRNRPTTSTTTDLDPPGGSTDPLADAWFDQFPQNVSADGKSLSLPTWDTWPLHYEHDGVDQDDGGTLIDEGTDGLDNDNANGVDDPNERETRPPYERPLRGIRITVRVYEPDTRQVRQISVIQNFASE